MKKKLVFSIGVRLLLLSFLLFTGCQKIFDYINLPGNGGAVSNICQVKTINSDQASYIFNYNKNGELESIITNKLGTGNPNAFFIYDKYHRTSQLLLSFTTAVNAPSGGYQAWEKFGYNATNQIVKDTVYEAGGIGSDGIIQASSLFVTYKALQYDAGNRVIGSTDSSYFKGTFANVQFYAYKYDDQGNLVYTARQYRAMQSWGEAVYNDTFRVLYYDTKIHLRRTNKMWMFIDRNYSVNNAFTAASYNSYGLPLVFDGRQYLQGLITLVPFIGGNTTITYNCN